MRKLTRHLYFWVLLAILAGGTLGLRRSGDRGEAEAARRRLHRARQDAHQPDHLLHRRPRHRRRRRHEEGRPRRRQGADLLRGRLDASRSSSASSWSTWCGRAPASTSTPPPSTRTPSPTTRSAPPTQTTTDFILHIIPTTFIDAFTGSGDLLQVLFVADPLRLRHDAHGRAGRHRAPLHRGLLAHLLRDDERADEAGADRRRRRDGVHHRPLRHRLAAAAGRADGQLLPDLPAVRPGGARHASPPSPASASCASSPTSRTSC